MKKLIAMMLCGAMMLGTTAAAAEKGVEVNYDTEEHVTITYGYSLGLDDATEYDDEFMQYVEEKFNCDIELWNVGGNEQGTLLINSGTMPTMLLMNDGFTLTDYVDQELVRALPDDWEEKFPNLAAMYNNAGTREGRMIDGVDYVIDHTVFGHFLQINPVPTHRHLYYRKDLAEKVGMADAFADYVVTIDEFLAYLDACYEQGLTEFKWMGTVNSHLRHFICNYTGISSMAWEDTGTEWVHIPSTEGYSGIIKEARELYQNGYVDADIAVQDLGYYDGLFVNGRIAAYYDGGTGGGMQNKAYTYAENTGADPLDIGNCQIAASDGHCYNSAVTNYCCNTLFAPEASDAEVERCLAIMDWISSEEGQISSQMGIPGVDWQYAEDGVTIQGINTPEYKSVTSGIFMWMGYCGDDLAFAPVEGGVVEPFYVEEHRNIFAVFEDTENATLYINPQAYTDFQSESKDNYSFDRSSKIFEIAYGDGDIDELWNAYIEEQRPIWEPLQEDLNAFYYGE